MAPPSLTEPSRVAIEAAFEAAVNALAVSPTVDEPRPSQLAYLGIQLLRHAGTRGRQAAEELLAEQDPLAAIANRPAREGKYFVVHRELLHAVEHTGIPVDMYVEFWAHHPHGGHPLLREFVVIELSDGQIISQRERIRLSSYRWENIKGLGPENKWATPGNFGWFLELCKEHGWIGWFDFMSNVVVNVPAAFTVGYMGKLYAESIVVPQGLFEPATLVAAMRRVWVFQESAFGALDEDGVRCLLARLRSLGRSRDVEVWLGAFAVAADGVAQLISRRGWLAFLVAEGATLTTVDDYDASDCPAFNDEVMADVLMQRFGGEAEETRLTRRQLTERSAYPRDWDRFKEMLAMVNKVVAASGFLAFHVLDYFTRPAAVNPAEPLMLKLLTTSRYEGLATADAFLDAFGLSILKAYGSLNVTFEADREVAVSEVARFILASRCGEEMGVEELLRRAWARAPVSSKKQGLAGFAIQGIQPTIPEGKRLLGLGTIKGTPMLANSYNGNPTCYKTASGKVHDTRGIMGTAVGFSFSDGVFADAKAQKYHGFVCNSPPLLSDEGALLIQVFRRVGDPSGLPAIVNVGLKKGTSFDGPPAAEEVAFD